MCTRWSSIGEESGSRSAAVKPPSSGDGESTGDVYTAVKLDFTVETVQLELFSGDQAVVCMSTLLKTIDIDMFSE